MRCRFFLLSIIVLLASCSNHIDIAEYVEDEPVLYPDYVGVTVPHNIAPLCFSVEGEEDVALIIKSRQDSLVMISDDGSFNIPEKAWRKLMAKEKGGSLNLTVCRKKEHKWQAMKPFEIFVSVDAIDPYLVYRRINPGYGLWNRMGIYQRCLENYEETAIYENREGRGNCVNCHSFCEGNPDRWQMHVRVKYAGTYIFDGKQQKILDLKDIAHGKPVYPNWHPNGKLVAYSTNSTFFFIHTLNTNRWEVMDDLSNVLVVDVETGEQYRSEFTNSAENHETFPCFSPDGKWLYFCSAPAPEDVISKYDSVQYNILRIAFDEDSFRFGNKVDTIYDALKDGGSASFPRISPDGKWLCFTRSKYGNFSICHRDADLCLINLEDGTMSELEEANSDQVDSFHSWSRNSRWMVVSSKRDNAIYTKPYFFHIDENGNASKAFVLPQRNARNYYDLEMDGYNIPELVTGKVPVEKIELVKAQQSMKQESASVN